MGRPLRGHEVLFALDPLVGEVIVLLAGDHVDLLFYLSPLFPALGHHIQSRLVVLVELVNNLESTDRVVFQLFLWGHYFLVSEFLSLLFFRFFLFVALHTVD